MATKTTATQIKVKKEISSEEIKEFAETAMNELLGWYGYDKVDRMEMTKDNKLPSSAALTTTVLATLQKRREKMDDICSNGMIATTESSLSDKDSSREDSRSPISLKIADIKDNDCSWCRRTIPTNCNEILGSPDGPIFCSESCFAQSRRASFKRAKLCDWCRHIRHAVSYVDFQDGNSQLQFCSDKCLNQYKMQIFCKETQAHLDMNPHLLKDKGIENSGGNLITPDLWLKNCKSRSASPMSECSRSLSPSVAAAAASSTSVPNLTAQTAQHQVVKKPIITVAPPSKLFTKNAQQIQSRQNLRLSKRRKQTRMHNQPLTSPAPLPTTGIPNLNNSNSNSNTQNNCSSSSNIGNSNNHHQHQNNNNNSAVNHNLHSNLNKNCTITSAQDLRASSNPSSAATAHTQPSPAPIDPNHHHRGNYPHQFLPPPPNLFPIRPQFMPRSPRMQNPNMQFPQFPHHFEFPRLPAMGGGPPPITILIPYPVILPLPIPIPIPIPLAELLRFTQKSQTTSEKPTVPPEVNGAHREMPKSTASSSVSSKFNDDDAPLDYTKSKDKTDQNSSVLRPTDITFNITTGKDPDLLEKNSNDHPEQLDNDVSNSDSGATTSKVEVELKGDAANHEIKLPKFKITRLNSKRISTKEYESSRPLRKRKRIIVDNE